MVSDEQLAKWAEEARLRASRNRRIWLILGPIIAVLAFSAIVGPYLPAPPPAAEVPVDASPSSMPPSPSPSPAPTVDPERVRTKMEMLTSYALLMATVKDCDAASSALEPELKRGDPIRAYRAAEVAESACLPVASKIRDFEVPDGLDEKNEDEFKTTLERCADTYVERWNAAGTLKSVIDGEARVSTMAELQRSTERAQSGVMLCSLGFVSAAMSAGVTQAELEALASPKTPSPAR